jgi:hypothetical protein
MPSTRDNRVITLTTALERNKPPFPVRSDICNPLEKVAEFTDPHGYWVEQAVCRRLLTISRRVASNSKPTGLTMSAGLGMIRGLICLYPPDFEELDGGQYTFCQKTRKTG